MAKDLEGLGVPILALPHHARPGLRPIDLKPVQTVSYEGGLPHLGKWKQWLEWECASRGWSFTVDQPGDIAVALREKTGYAPMNWKSNVKLANAQGSGTPIICAREQGYLETASGGEFFADTEEEVQWAFDALTPVEMRREVSGRMLKAAPSLESVAATYKTWLQRF
jgi:hypothetical protein